MSESNSTEYRPIKDFPGYRVGDNGSVWSCWKRGRQHKYFISDEWRPLRPKTDKDGYREVQLFRDGDSFTRKVHRLVLEAFVGPCPEGMECRHLHGDPADNRLAQLAWGTKSENADDQLAHKTRPIGVRHGIAKLNPEAIREIRRRCAAGEHQKTVGLAFGIRQSTVSCIVLRKTWGHVA